jgi:hypothetical protein
MAAPIGNRNAARAAEWTATVGVALHRVRLDWVRGKGRLSALATVLGNLPGHPLRSRDRLPPRRPIKAQIGMELAEPIDEK